MKSVIQHTTSIIQENKKESRKVRKPLMEKKRRARINDSLEVLKQILLESKNWTREGTSKKSGQRTAKLEKADILELTVQYLQHLHQKLNGIQSKGSTVTRSLADSSTDRIKVGVALIPTRLKTGELVFVPSSEDSNVKRESVGYSEKMGEQVWRPW